MDFIECKAFPASPPSGVGMTCFLKRVVVERVIKIGRLSDWYGAFDLYGGIRGFRKIARDEVIDLSSRDLDFVCMALTPNFQLSTNHCF
jgi:hypothetical protein